MTVRAYSAKGVLRETREASGSTAHWIAKRLSREGGIVVVQVGARLVWYQHGHTFEPLPNYVRRMLDDKWDRQELLKASASGEGSVEALRGGRP